MILRSGMHSPLGRMSVFVSGSNIAVEDRSFDLLIDGIWIGRLRVRIVDLLRPLSLHTLRTTFHYRLPSALVRPGPATLTVVALDEQKMPSKRPLPGIGVAAEIPGETAAPDTQIHSSN
jgi:hypothetical protein